MSSVEGQNGNNPPMSDQNAQNRMCQVGIASTLNRLEQEDEIDLRELWKKVCTGRKVITSIAFLFALTAIVISLMLPNIYKAEALLASTGEEEKSALAGFAGQYGGLASLAGINLGGGAVDKTALALEVLKSRVFLTKFIHKHKLEVPLIAAKGWDENSKLWQINSAIYDEVSGKWVRDVKPPYRPAPSDLELHEEFTKNVLLVSQDAKTGLIRISISLMSPEESARWVNLLVKELNEYLRVRDVEEAKKSISFLKEQLSQTSIADMQQIFYQLIEQQTKTIMLTQVREEYVFKVLDPAVVPERTIRPKRILICMISTIIGVIFGVIIVLIRQSDASLQ